MSAAYCSVRVTGRVWSPSCCPDKETIVNALVTQIWDFTLAVRQFAIKRCLRCVASCCCCIGRGYTLHVQGGTVSWDSSGSENISWLGLRSCASSGFCGNARVSECFTAYHSVNACVVSSCGFGGAANFSVFQLWVQKRNQTIGTDQILSTPCYQVVAARW